MRLKSAERKKEENIQVMRSMLNKHETNNEKIEYLMKYFNFMRNTDINSAYHSYKNFLEMPESKEMMYERYISSADNVSDLVSYSTQEQSLYDIINWVAITLEYFHEEINKFVSHRNEFNKSLLLGNYEHAEEILSNIEGYTGKSLWSNASWLNIYYFKQDTQEHNRLSKNVLSVPDQLSRSVLSYELIRCNRAISPERYHFFIGKMIEEFRLSDDNMAESILLYRHLFDPSVFFPEINIIYKSTYEQRLIDLYNSFIKILSYLEIHGDSLYQCKQHLLSISKKINDREFDILIRRLYLSHKPENDMLQESYDRAVSYYLKEDYVGVIKEVEKTLTEAPYFSVLYIPYAKSLNKIKKVSSLPGNINDVIRTIQLIYKEEQFEKNIELLSKLYYVLSHNNWASILSCILTEYEGVDNKSIPTKFNFVDNTALYTNQFSLRENNKSIINDLSIPKWRRDKFFAELLYYKNDFQSSMDKYSSIQGEYSKQVKSKIIQCLFYLGRTDDAINELSNALLSRTNPKSLPVVLIARYINTNSEYSKNNIILYNKAVILHFYISFYNNEFTQTLSNICENYLENINVFDSESITHQSNIEKYLIDKILTLDVLDGMSSILENDIDVLKCRLNINREILSSKEHYTEKDIESALEEVRQIFYKTVVEICSNEAGDGKIYVDKPGLKNKLLNDATKLFDEIYNEKDKEITFDYNENVNVRYENESSSMSYYSSDKNFVNKILDLLYVVYSAYALDKIYGLDQSLNMGIRHGGLINLLWYPLKNNDLAAIKSKDNKFSPNPIWRNFFGYFQESALTKVDEALISFNYRVHKLVSEVKSKINVNIGEYGTNEKWFNYIPDYDMQLLVATKFDSYNTESFIEEMFLHLDEHTESCLEKIQEIYIPELEKLIMSEIDLLEEELISIGITFINLKRAISKAKVEMKESLDHLSKWFTWTGESKTSFDFKAAIDKAISAVEQFHSWMIIKLDQEITSNCHIKGKFFTDTVMLLTLLFENAVKHSNSKENCNIAITVEESEDKIRIIVTNNLDHDLNDDNLQTIENINNDLESNKLDNFTKDNGSGLYKVKKIITHHFKTDSSVLIAYRNKQFIVNINIDKSTNFIDE